MSLDDGLDKRANARGASAAPEAAREVKRGAQVPGLVRGGDLVPANEESGVDRRQFVRGAVWTAGLAVASANGVGIFRQVAVLPDLDVRDIDYVGIEALTGSPAPRGLPLIPVAVDDEGFVVGVPETQGENHLDWYRHCGHESAPGLQPGGEADNRLYYFVNDEKIRSADPQVRQGWWYLPRLGEPMRASDWANQPFGTGAPVQWRSQGQSGDDIVTALVLKIDPDSVRGRAGNQLTRFMDMDHHLMAVSTYCTHLCCVPAYKEDPTAKRLGFWDMVFCTCHLSRFDPSRLQPYSFTMRAPKIV